jgi:dihydroorotate dehydrogenase electron transfer subunit
LDDPAAKTFATLEERGIVARLASLSDFPGVFRGYITDLARRYLQSQSASSLVRTELFACGPTPMLHAVSALAREFNLPCQVSLEEYMACAVGGCAGCTVRVMTNDGPAMERVCVDGPVFEASQVFAND